MNDLLIAIGLSASFLLNAYLYGTVIRMRRANAHVHVWTPWSEWYTLEGENSRTFVEFRRVRYCTGCAKEHRQNVGGHYCDDLNIIRPARERHCTHRELYTEIFDPMYELRQINKDLEELQ